MWIHWPKNGGPNIVLKRSHFSMFFSQNPQIFGLQKTWDRSQRSQLRGWSGGIGVHNHCALWGAESLHWGPRPRVFSGYLEDRIIPGLGGPRGYTPPPGRWKRLGNLRIRGGTPLEKEKNLKQSIMISGSMSIFQGVITMGSFISPQNLWWDPLPNVWTFMAEINGGDSITTYPSPGMILQVEGLLGDGALLWVGPYQS